MIGWGHAVTNSFILLPQRPRPPASSKFPFWIYPLATSIYHMHNQPSFFLETGVAAFSG